MKNKLTMPFTSAGIIGLGETLITTAVAAASHDDVRAEALTTLVGGTITGAIAGLIRCALPDVDEDSSTCLRRTITILHYSLSLGAMIVAPLMGEACLELRSDWRQTMADGVIGNALTFGVFVGLTVAATNRNSVLSGYSNFRFFSNLSESEENRMRLTIDAPNIV